MGDRGEGTASGNSEVGEWGRENDVMIQTIVERWQGRNRRGNVGLGGGGEGSDRGYDQVPNEDRSGIGKQDIDFGNGPDDGKSGMPDDSMDEWKEEEPASCRQSTKTQRVGEGVPRQMPEGRTRLKHLRKKRHGWTR